MPLAHMICLSYFFFFMVPIFEYLMPHYFVVILTAADFHNVITQQDMPSRRLQHVFSVTIFGPPRRLEDFLERRLGKRKIVTLKTSSIRLPDMPSRRLQDMSSRHSEGMYSRHL